MKESLDNVNYTPLKNSTEFSEVGVFLLYFSDKTTFRKTIFNRTFNYIFRTQRRFYNSDYCFHSRFHKRNF